MELLNGHTTHPDAQWYPEAELGVFVHWGISSVHGNIDISWSMMKDFKWTPERVSPDEYFSLAKNFNPTEYHPEKWAKAAKDAGFKYMVLTTKHHDGFAMWPSNFGNFNTKNYMNGRDLVGEYIKACRDNGLKVGLYYSPPDWWIMKDYMSFDGWYENEKTKNPPPQVVTDYHRSVIRGQVSELLTNYGKIDLIWFDGPGLDYITREEIYAYQPHIVIGRAFETDFRSTECELPDEEYYEKNLKGYWWECCHEWNSCWGYTKDEEYKPVSTIIDFYKITRKFGGNLLINVAPKANGELPEVVYERLKEFGKWLEDYRKNN